MPIEQETFGMMIYGFLLIMGISLLIVLLQIFSKKRNNKLSGYVWMLGHLIFITVTFICLLETFRFDAGHPMASEEVSLRLGITGVSWAISMVFFIAAVLAFSSKKRTA
ncbi:MAG TPA: hypothetical protein VIG80_10595 [Bacillaceae bacterium]